MTEGNGAGRVYWVGGSKGGVGKSMMTWRCWTTCSSKRAGWSSLSARRRTRTCGRSFLSATEQSSGGGAGRSGRSSPRSCRERRGDVREGGRSTRLRRRAVAALPLARRARPTLTATRLEHRDGARVLRFVLRVIRGRARGVHRALASRTRLDPGTACLPRRRADDHRDYRESLRGRRLRADRTLQAQSPDHRAGEGLGAGHLPSERRGRADAAVLRRDPERAQSVRRGQRAPSRRATGTTRHLAADGVAPRGCRSNWKSVPFTPSRFDCSRRKPRCLVSCAKRSCRWRRCAGSGWRTSLRRRMLQRRNSSAKPRRCSVPPTKKLASAKKDGAPIANEIANGQSWHCSRDGCGYESARSSYKVAAPRPRRLGPTARLEPDRKPGSPAVAARLSMRNLG